MLEKDLLGHLVNFKDEKMQTLTEDQIADNIIGVLFAAQESGYNSQCANMDSKIPP